MGFRIFKAFAATFAYLAEHWLVLLRAMWLPALILTAVQLYAAPGLFAALAEFALLGPNPEPEAAGAAFSRLAAAGVFYLLAGLIFFPMLTVASLRHIVLGEQSRLPFYFAYGADETRIMGANFLFNLMVVVIALVADLAVGVLVAVLGLLGPAAAPVLKSAGSFLTQLATGWFQVRLSPLFPAVLASGTLGLGVAFDSTRAAVLRLAAFWILIGLVVAPVIVVLLLPLSLQMAGDIGALQGGNSAAVAAFFQKLSALLAPVAPGFPLAAACVYAMTLIVNAVVNIASAVAWRFLSAKRGEAGAVL